MVRDKALRVREESWVILTNHLDMTIAVDWDIKHKPNQQTMILDMGLLKKNISKLNSR